MKLASFILSLLLIVVMATGPCVACLRGARFQQASHQPAQLHTCCVRADGSIDTADTSPPRCPMMPEQDNQHPPEPMACCAAVTNLMAITSLGMQMFDVPAEATAAVLVQIPSSRSLVPATPPPRGA